MALKRYWLIAIGLAVTLLPLAIVLVEAGVSLWAVRAVVVAIMLGVLVPLRRTDYKVTQWSR